MFIAQFAKRVGRSVDTIKRWEGEGLLQPARDDLDRRVYNEQHVSLCLEIAKLGLAAKRHSKKLKYLVETMPTQLGLLEDEQILVGGRLD